MTQQALTQDPWTVADAPEYGCMPLAPLRRMNRAGDAIHAIARLIGNAVRGNEAPDPLPVDNWTVGALMGGIESLCDHLNDLADGMAASAEARGKWADDAPETATDQRNSLQ